MPRAHDGSLFHVAFRQGRSHMRAEIVDREIAALIVEHAEPWVAFQGAQRAVEKVVRETGRTLRPEAEFGPAGAGPVYRVSSLVPAPGPGPGRDGE